MVIEWSFKSGDEEWRFNPETGMVTFLVYPTMYSDQPVKYGDVLSVSSARALRLQLDQYIEAKEAAGE